MPVAAGEGWTPEQVHKMKTMWADGAPASDIAAAMGDGKTRSSVLGKINRMKLTRGGPQHASTSQAQRDEARAQRAVRVKPPKDRREQNGGNLAQKLRAIKSDQKHRKIAPPMVGSARARAMVSAGVMPDPAEMPPAPAVGAAFEPLPGSEPVDLEHLTACKWPVGDHPTMFCNLPQAERPKKRPTDPVLHEVYCPVHDRMSKPRADKRAVRRTAA